MGGDDLCPHGVTAKACVDCLCRDARWYMARRDDPRDAEIAALKAELEAERFDTRILRRNLDQARDDHDAEATRLRAALAAGPAALRKLAADNLTDYAASLYLQAADDVEAAQAAAMKE